MTTAPAVTQPLGEVEQIEAAIARLGRRIEVYGSMDATPADLLRQYAALWNRWTWAMAEQEAAEG